MAKMLMASLEFKEDICIHRIIKTVLTTIKILISKVAVPRAERLVSALVQAHQTILVFMIRRFLNLLTRTLSALLMASSAIILAYGLLIMIQ